MTAPTHPITPSRQLTRPGSQEVPMPLLTTIAARAMGLVRILSRTLGCAADIVHIWDGGHRAFASTLALASAWAADDWPRLCLLVIEICLGLHLAAQSGGHGLQAGRMIFVSGEHER